MSEARVTVTDAAVEAAVKAWDHHWGDRYGDEALEEMGEEVRVALEAAAPHLIAFPMGMTESEWKKYLDSYR